MKTKKEIKKKVAAKTAKGKSKVARKVAKACVLLAALAVAGCMGTAQPSRSQTLNISDCTINIYGSGDGTTNDVARVEIASQAMSIENSGTETQTATPSNTVDVPVRIDARYNDAIKTATDASKGVLEQLVPASANEVAKLMASKETGIVKVTKTDGSTATVKCDGGQCSLCEDGSCAPAAAAK